MDASVKRVFPVAAVIAMVLGGMALGTPGQERDPAAPDLIEGRPNIVVVSLTTLRADHLPCYGYDRRTAPNICGFAEENVRFDRVYAQGIWTLPSYASLLTGRYPEVHNATTAVRGSLPDGATTLPEVLRPSGYRTAAFLGQGYHAPQFGFDQGFDRYVEVDTQGNRDINRSVSRALDWMNGSREPFFLYVQGYDVHAPFHPPEPYRGRYDDGYEGPLTRFSLDYNAEDAALHRIFQTPDGPIVRTGNGSIPLDDADIQHIIDRYDEGVRHGDAVVGRFLEALRQRGRFDDTVVIVLSEHGETLADRRVTGEGLFGRRGPYEEVIHVPLAMHVPGLSPRAVEGKVELVDLMPTLLDMAEVPDAGRPRTQGESLLPLLTGSAGGGDEYVFSEADPSPAVAVRGDRWKLVRWSRGSTVLYDLTAPTPETRNVARQHPGVAERFRERLEVWTVANRQYD